MGYYSSNYSFTSDAENDVYVHARGEHTCKTRPVGPRVFVGSVVTRIGFDGSGPSRRGFEYVV